MILVDTNILARLPNGNDPLRKIAKASLVALMRRQERLVIAPQCLYEFWVVMTRPTADNGYGFSAERAGRWLHRLRHLATLLGNESGLYENRERLVTSRSVLGKKGHDARLAAWMEVHGVASILTFNVSDFARFGVSVIDPRVLVAP